MYYTLGCSVKQVLSGLDVEHLLSETPNQLQEFVTAYHVDPGFQFIGGHACLDFINTLSQRLHEHPQDHLSGYDDLVRWTRQVSLISHPTAEQLQERAAGDPNAGLAVLTRAQRLREALYGIFSAIAVGDSPPIESFEILNAEISRTFPHMRLEYGDQTVGWASDDTSSLDSPLRAIVRVATELLVSSSLARVHECDAEKCSWLFLDSTRNRSRRWCDAKACGNRERVKRHYWRHRRESLAKSGRPAITRRKT